MVVEVLQWEFDREAVEMRQRASMEAGLFGADRAEVSRSPLGARAASEADLTRVPLYAAAAHRPSGRGAEAERAADRAAAGEASALGTSGPTMPAAGLRALGSGSPLPDEVRVEAEARLDTDFADVRVHTDDTADRAARLEGSTAFTQGTDIAFRRGAWAPGSPAGRQLIHHELGHVTQQRAQGAVGLQRQQSRDWQAVADTLTADELSAEVDRLNLLLQDAIESNDLTIGWMDQLAVYEQALAARRAGQQAVRSAAEANRAATRGAVAQTGSTAEAALVTAFALDQSVEGLFSAGFYTGLQAQVPPAEISRFTTNLQQNFGSFYGGYLLGVPIGLGRGLVGLIEGVATLIQIGMALSPGALLVAGAEEAFSLITSSEHRALRVAQYEQLQRFRAALVELMNDFSSDPTVLMSWSSEVGIAAGEGFGQGLTDEFFRVSVFEQGKMLGNFVGQVMFEVLLEILLAVATAGIGNALRAVAAVGQGARVGGRFAGFIRRVMETSPRIRRLIDILTEVSGTVRRSQGATEGAESAADVVRTSEQAAEGAESAADVTRTGEQAAAGETVVGSTESAVGESAAVASTTDEAAQAARLAEEAATKPLNPMPELGRPSPTPELGRPSPTPELGRPSPTPEPVPPVEEPAGGAGVPPVEEPAGGAGVPPVEEPATDTPAPASDTTPTTRRDKRIRIIRQDNDFEALVNRKGVPKSHLDEDGSLVPANPDGTATPLQHVIGSSGKENSPYTSFMTEEEGVAKAYGSQEIELDLPELQADIAAGRAEGVSVVTHEELVGSIRSEITARFPTADPDAALARGPDGLAEYVESLGLSKTKSGELARRLIALSNARRDGELLVKGPIPARYISGPKPVPPTTNGPPSGSPPPTPPPPPTETSP